MKCKERGQTMTFFKRIAALLLCALLLGGTGRAWALDGTAYDEIIYRRPSLADIQSAVDALEEALARGEALERLEEQLDEIGALYDEFDTMATIAEIENNRDLSDAYWQRESAWCSEHYSELQRLLDESYSACAQSTRGEALERDYFWPGFREEYGEDRETLYTDDLIALMQEESRLVSEYRALLSEASIDLGSGEINYRQALTALDGDELARAEELYRYKYNEAFAELFLRLLRVRQQQAQALGYADYEEMAYDFNYGRDYTAAQAAVFLDSIREELIPVYSSIMAGDPYADVYYDLVDEDVLLQLLDAAASTVGGAAEAAFDFMLRYGLYDVSPGSTKADLSFQVYLTAYDEPYLFMNPYGDSADILTLFHEFGHFTDAFCNSGASETIDLAEVYSQASEYLSLYALGDALPREEQENLLRLKLLDTLELYAQQGAWAEFESVIYASSPDELDTEALNDLSLRVCREYGLCTDGQEESYAMLWMDVPHLFEQPLYIISYPVSNDLALQLYAMEREEAGSGMARYRQMLERADPDSGEILTGLSELVERYGFDSPFAEGHMQKTAALLAEAFDLTARA